MPATLIYDDVACPGCSLVCDDATVEVEDGRVVRVAGECAKAKQWFLAATRPSDRAAAEIAGEPVALEAALNEAARTMNNARAPLVFGLGASSIEGSRAAVALADRLGATIDVVDSGGERAETLAFQQFGLSTCSLGDLRHRADLVVVWNADPATSHPRLLERFVDPPGDFVPGGRAERTLVVVDSQPTATGELADQFIPIERGRDLDVITTLRLLLRGEHVASTKGAEIGTLQTLVERLRRCRYGVLLFGETLAGGAKGRQTIEALTRLVAEMNDIARFAALRLGSGSPGAATAAKVLCWQTGYPPPVNFAGCYPRHSPGEYSAEAVLSRGEADACVLIGSSAAGTLSPAAQAALAKLPVVLLDSPLEESPFAARVRFTTAIYGVHRAGTVSRMDEVPLPLRAIMPSPLPSDAEVLAGIAARLDARTS